MPAEVGPSLSAQGYAHQVGLELENSEMGRRGEGLGGVGGRGGGQARTEDASHGEAGSGERGCINSASEYSLSIYYVPSPFPGIEDTIVNKANRTLGSVVRMGTVPQKLSKIYATLDSDNLNEVRNVVT